MNYYKILNENEWHRGMCYRTGWNVDIKPFNPYGNCETGGLYYAREDILAFLEYGSWIRKVTIPSFAQVYCNPGYPKKWKAQQIILGERKRITTKIIQKLIEEGANSIYLTQIWTSRHIINNWNFEELDEFFSTFSSHMGHLSDFLIYAHRTRCCNLIKLIFKHFKPSPDNIQQMILRLIQNNYHDALECLLNNLTPIQVQACFIQSLKVAQRQDRFTCADIISQRHDVVFHKA